MKPPSKADQFLRILDKGGFRKPTEPLAGDVGRELPAPMAPNVYEADDFLRIIGKPFPGPVAQGTPDNPPGTRLGRALETGFQNVKAMTAQGVEGLAGLTGLEGMEERMRIAESNARYRLAELEKYATTYEEAKTSVGKFALFAGESVAEQLPDVLTTGGPAAIGSFFGPLGTAVGAGIGLGLTALQSYGEQRTAQENADVEAGRKVEVDEGAALLATIPHAALDYVGDRFLLSGLTPKAGQSLFTRVVKGAAGGALVEVPTELGQTVIERFQAGQDLTSEDALKAYEEVAVVAGLAGGAIKGTVSAVVPGAPGPGPHIKTTAPYLPGKAKEFNIENETAEDLGLLTEDEEIELSLREQAFYSEEEKTAPLNDRDAVDGRDGQIGQKLASNNPKTRVGFGPRGGTPGPSDLAGTFNDENLAGSEEVSFDFDTEFEPLTDEIPITSKQELTNFMVSQGLIDTGIEPGGSNITGVYDRPDAGLYFVKANKSAEQTLQEIEAYEALKAFASDVTPQLSKVKSKDGKTPQVLYANYIDPKDQIPYDSNNPKHRGLIADNFAVNAWLGNWDVIGPDEKNVFFVNDGSKLGIAFVDTGGALEYRAQGEKKGNKFTEEVIEFNSMRDKNINPTAAKVFGELTPEEIAKQVIRLGDQYLMKSNKGETLFSSPALDEKMLARLINLMEKVGPNVSKLSMPTYVKIKEDLQKKQQKRDAVTIHPKLDENGNKVVINRPSKASPLKNLAFTDESFTFVPGGYLSSGTALNNISFLAWNHAPTTPAGWEELAAKNPIADQPVFDVPKGLQPAAGAVIVEADGRIWMAKPTNGFGGKSLIFPKGRTEGMSLEATALKEVYEETGLKVKLTGFLADVKGDTTLTRYYLAERVGGNPTTMGWESQAVVLVTPQDLQKLHSSFKGIVQALVDKLLIDFSLLRAASKTLVWKKKQSLTEQVKEIVKKAEEYKTFNESILIKHTGNDHITQTFMQEPLLRNVLELDALWKWLVGNTVWWDTKTKSLVVTKPGELSKNFKELKTQVLSRNLIPAVMFHGTHYDGGVNIDPETGAPYLFKMWLPKMQGTGLGGRDTIVGMFLTDSARGAAQWATGQELKNKQISVEELLTEGVIPLIVNIKKPWLYNAGGQKWHAQKTIKLAEKAKRYGVDALIKINVHDGVHGNQIVLFNPQEQAASPNSKTFDPNNKTFLKSLAGEVMKFHTLTTQEKEKLEQQLESVGLQGTVDLRFFPFRSDKGYQGVFSRDVRGTYIGLARNMPSKYGHQGIMRHELIHALKSYGFFASPRGKAIWTVLKNEVARRGGISQTVKEQYPISQQLEEEIARLAEMYENGTLGQESLTRAGKALKAIGDFFRALANWARGLGFQTAESALDYIYSGNLKDGAWLGEVEDRRETMEIDNLEEEIFFSKVAIQKILKKKGNVGNPDYFGRLVKYGWNIVQLARKNPHVKWLQNYVERARQWHQAKTVWLERASETAAMWTNLSIEEQKSLANFLFAMERMEYRSQEELAKGVVRKPSKAEFIALAEKYQMTKAGMDVYKKVRQDFRDILAHIEKVIIRAVSKQFAANPAIVMLEVAKVQKEFKLLAQRPYFPHARFGTYTIVTKDAKGKTLYMEAFESLEERNEAVDEVKQKFPEAKGYITTLSKLSEEQKVYQGLPQSLLLALHENLKLDADQKAALDDLIINSAPAVSFKHHLAKRKNVAGYSEDALRAYSEYFFHGANHLARIEYGPLMEEEIAAGNAEIKEMMNVQGSDTTKRVQMLDFAKHHLDNLMNPKEDWAALRSASFMWHLAFNVKSAVVNFSQIPMVTYSHLAARFGDAKTAKALTRNMDQLKNLFRSTDSAVKRLSAVDQKFAEEAVADGIWDESFAAELAGLAEGSNLNKSMAKTRWRKLTLQFNHIGGYLFQAVEKLNRRVAFLAAVDLAKDAGPDNAYVKEVEARSQIKIQELIAKGFTPEQALIYTVARDTVDQTQFTYSKYAQPRMMEGRKNAFLTFFMFVQNMLWFLQNNPGMTRYLLILLVFAGIKGLPFEDDLEQLTEGVAARLGIQLDIEREVRELTMALFGDTVNPDFLLRGVSRQGFGLKTLGDLTGIPLPSVDLSGSLGMGSPVHILSPTLQATGKLLKGQEFNDVFASYTADSVGPTFGIPLEIIKALASNDLPWGDTKRWEPAMPSAVRGLFRAGRYAIEGEERGRTGAQVVEFDRNDLGAWMDIIAQGAGFTPTRVNRAWDRISMQAQAEAFWKGRRTALYSQYFWAKSRNDAEAIAEVMNAVGRYNKSVPYSSMRIGKKNLEASYKNRIRDQKNKESGVASQKGMQPLVDELSTLHRVE